jgi:glycosyltransferase involved in cell wall biosynthesis
MRIVLVNTFYYPKFVGGAEIFVQQLAEGLVNKGHSVYVLAMGESNRVYRVNNVVIITIKQCNIYSSFNGTAEKPASLKIIWHLIDSANIGYHFKLSRLLKRIKPDIVHTHNIHGFSPFIWLTIKRYKIKLVHTLHDYYLLCNKYTRFKSGLNCEGLCMSCKATSSIKRLFLNYPDHYTGISRYSLAVHTDNLNITKPTSIVYNGTSPKEIAIERWRSADIVLGYIGRISEDKGVLYFVNELEALSTNLKKNIKVIFAGAGQESFVNSLKSKLIGIKHEFAGVMDPALFFNQINLLIVPSIWNEPFGLTVIESLAYGVPVCQSDRGGLQELHNPESGWIFSPEAGKLNTILTHILLNEHEIEVKKSNCAKSARRFPAEENLERYIQTYDRLIKKPKGLKKEDTYQIITSVASE